MRHIAATKFDYEDPKFGEGHKTGVLTKDLEKTPAGRGMVKTTSAGKFIDVGQGFGTFLASLANLNRRVEHMERRR